MNQEKKDILSLNQHKDATKQFDYTTIAARFRALSCSDNSYPSVGLYQVILFRDVCK